MSIGDRLAAAVHSPRRWRAGAVGLLLLAVVEIALGVWSAVDGAASWKFFVVALLCAGSAVLFRYQARQLERRGL